jgi:hypothetical protein
MKTPSDELRSSAPSIGRMTPPVWLLLPLLALPALWTFYGEGLPRTFDGGLHLLRVGQIDALLRQGTLLPRWFPDLLLGFGYPLLNFYAPGSYVLIEVLHLIGFSFYSAFVLAWAAIILTAGSGMYLLALSTFGKGQRWSALLAATAYMYSPYLFMNIFISGAPAAASAQALLPWVMWCVRGLLRGSNPVRWTMPLVVTLTGIILSHNLTTLFAAPMLAGYAILHWWVAGRSWRRAGWLAVGAGAAIGISAFYWLPMLLEMQYLSDALRDISSGVLLPHAFWKWDNFLDLNWAYTLSFERPIRLGLLQLLLAGIGFALALPATREWWFLFGVTIIGCALMGEWALPIWTNSELLSLVQFPWRLLAIVSLPLALFTGGIVLRARRQWQAAALACLLAMLVVQTQRPRLHWMDMFDPQSMAVSPAVFAQIEADRGALSGGEGVSSLQEFRPRWADRTLTYDKQADEITQLDRIAPLRGKPGELELSLSATTSATLRLTNFFFPGWLATLDNETVLPSRPTTNLGLLTVDIPPGQHTLRVAWRGTNVQMSASLISLLTLLGLGWLCLWQPALRRWVLFPLALLLVMLVGRLWSPPPGQIATLQQPLLQHGIELTGLQFERDTTMNVVVRPYWYVRHSPPADLRMRWQVLDSQGNLIGEQTGRAFFNTTPLDNWPTGTLVDDAALLPFPADAAAGRYSVAVGLGRSEEELAAAMHIVGQVTLTEPTASNPAPQQRQYAQIGENISLVGFDLFADGAPAQTTPNTVAQVDEAPSNHVRANPLATIVSGQTAHLILYWQANGPITENDHGFVHLVDWQGAPLAQEDHLPGPFFSPPALWQPGRLQRDSYLLRIPHNAPSGLVWPQAGLYDFGSMERLPVVVDQSSEVGDHVRLPPIKLIQRSQPAPQHSSDVRVGEWAHLIGFDLQPSAMVLQPGDTLTVTLHFRSDTHSPVDYTRFVHLYDPALGMAAQSDGLPQQGANPTWAWTPGEQIVDRVTLQVAADAKPGRYRLISGFYDAQAAGERVALFGDDGQQLTDNLAILSDVVIEAGDPSVQ